MLGFSEVALEASRDEKGFAGVTLAWDGGLMQAHKVIPLFALLLNYPI